MSTILYVLLALLMLGIMITVHELGHFLAARACGIAVRSFGIGFGPRIAHWTSKKTGTEYSFRLIPAGGFCGFYGEDDAEGKDKDDPRSLNNQAAWKRLVTIAFGPIMNFVLAFVVGLVFFFGYGLPVADGDIISQVTEVTAGSPADAAGMQAGDIITAINGAAVSDNVSELVSQYQVGGEPLKVTVLRSEETLDLFVTPAFDAKENRLLMGIMMTVGYGEDYEIIWQRMDAGTTIRHTWDTCVSAGSMILDSLKGLVTRGEGLDQMAGPVGVINVIAQETRTYKLMGYLNMLMMISINLGLVNLLPIPGLDGCRILFVLFEMIFRRSVNRTVEAYIHLAGYVLLIGLMIFFTFKDVLNIFG